MHQRKGSGLIIGEYVIDEARWKGKRIFLQATPKGSHVWLKLGSEINAEAVVDLKDFGEKEHTFKVQWFGVHPQKRKWRRVEAHRMNGVIMGAYDGDLVVTDADVLWASFWQYPRFMIDHQLLISICPRPKDLEAEIFLIKHGTCFRFPKPRQGTLIRDSGFKSVSLIILHSNIWRTHMTLLNFTESLNSGIHL